jgi:uncharacterized protein DUF6484
MANQRDALEVELTEHETDDLAALSRRPVSAREPASLVDGHAHIVQFHGFDSSNRPLISGVLGLPDAVIPARATIRLRDEQMGSNLVVLFEQGDVQRPIIVGLLQDQRPAADRPDAPKPTVSVKMDDDRLVLSADREIELSCGAAKIILTRAGKVLIQGAYVSSRSSGVNRIKGGSVQIN